MGLQWKWIFLFKENNISELINMYSQGKQEANHQGPWCTGWQGEGGLLEPNLEESFLEEQKIYFNEVINDPFW